MAEDRLMKRKEVADMLNCSQRTVARMDADLQPVKVRGRPRYYRSEVEKYLGRKGEHKKKEE